MAVLAQIALLITIHSVACETGFSKLKLIKTDLRNALKGRTLSCLMLLSILGGSVQQMDDEKFFTDSVHLWYETSPRRIELSFEDALPRSLRELLLNEKLGSGSSSSSSSAKS